jgi:threonine dehydrogenase-like Zn-dependent dehydrogenase
VPRILGHENVGIIEKLGELAGERWGVKVGDYVALEEYLPCGNCDLCRAGEYRACQQTNHMDGNLRYGSTKTSVWPGLWGGYSQFTYIHPRAVMHKVPANVPPRMAAMALPLGNGFQWAVLDGGASVGETSSFRAPDNRDSRASWPPKRPVRGQLSRPASRRDRQRLDVAKQLGADYTIAVDEESMRDRVAEITNGRGADLVLDVSSGGATEVINGGLDILKPRHGRFIAAAFKRKDDRRLRARYGDQQDDQLPRRARSQLQVGRDGARFDGVGRDRSRSDVDARVRSRRRRRSVAFGRR